MTTDISDSSPISLIGPAGSVELPEGVIVAARHRHVGPDEEGRMTIALNAHRMQDVKKELRPVWAHPAIWAVLALALAIGAGIAI